MPSLPQLQLVAGARAPAAPRPPLGAAPEPYEPLHGGAFSGRAAPLSPDPLVRYQFTEPALNLTALQIFTVRPVAVAVLSGSCDSCASLATAQPRATIRGPVVLRLDFGVELPAWFEVDAADYNGSAPLTMGVGEYHTPWQSGGGSWKSGAPKRYGATLRLETNAELYEGVRFGFLSVGNTSGPPGTPFAPFTITMARAVAQAKPVNYSGHFHSAADPLLERVWYTAAWTVRANLLAAGLVQTSQGASSY